MLQTKVASTDSIEASINEKDNDIPLDALKSVKKAKKKINKSI